MSSVLPLGFRLTPQVTAESEGMQLQAAQPNTHSMEHEQPPLQVRNQPDAPVPRDDVPDPAYNQQREHHTRTSRAWTDWVPPKGRVRWGYAALIALLLLVVIIAPVGVNENLKKSKREVSEASKALFTKTYEALAMPTNTTGIFRDPFNSTGIYRVFRGEDRTGNDIFATIEYTIEACLLACNKHNEFVGDGRSPCIAGTMNYNQQESANGQGANCFLKTKVGTDIDRTNPMALGFQLCRLGNCSSNSTGA